MNNLSSAAGSFYRLEIFPNLQQRLFIRRLGVVWWVRVGSWSCRESGRAGESETGRVSVFWRASGSWTQSPYSICIGRRTSFYQRRRAGACARLAGGIGLLGVEFSKICLHPQLPGSGPLPVRLEPLGALHTLATLSDQGSIHTQAMPTLVQSQRSQCLQAR